MPDHDLEQLLGGFAADTLTPEEQARLYSAALRDQQLFDALADEQALKELLADPAVRRRLLQALNQTGTSGPVRWIDWFRHPSGLAWAGGLAAAVFAVVLGTQIYQDSLKHAAESVATESTRPATPASPAPSLPQSESSSIHDLPAHTKPLEAPAEKVAKNHALLDQVMTQEQTAAPASRKQKSSDGTAGLEKRYRTHDQPELKTETVPHDEYAKSATGASQEAEQTQAPGAPTASAPAPSYTHDRSSAVGDAAITPTISARTRFYGETSTGTALGAFATEQKPSKTLEAKSALQARKPEQRDAQSSHLKQPTETVSSAKPLGLRYSFMIQGADGRHREVSASAASEHGGPVFMTVDSNQDAYLQLWVTTTSDSLHLLLPEKSSDRTDLKLLAGQRQSILMPTEKKPITVTARLSRIPLHPTLEQNPSLMARPGIHLLQETVSAVIGASPQEEATYTVNQDASVNQLTVNIPFPPP